MEDTKAKTGEYTILTKKGKTKNLSAPIWAAIIILGEMIGAAVYLIVGRSE